MPKKGSKKVFKEALPDRSKIPSWNEKKPNTRLIEDLVVKEMPGRKTGHFSMDTKSEAMALYLYGHGFEEIRDKFGVTPEGEYNVSIELLQAWAHQYKWDERRAEVWSESYSKMVAPFANCGTYAYQTGLAILADQLRIKMAKNEELEWDELKKLSDIIVSVQKVARLDEGKATEIREEKTLYEQRQEIRMILESDPFEEFAVDVTPTKELDEPTSSDGVRETDSGA